MGKRGSEKSVRIKSRSDQPAMATLSSQHRHTFFQALTEGTHWLEHSFFFYVGAGD